MIYLFKIKDMPILKIGYTRAPETRYKSLQGAIPFELILLAERNGSLDLEREVHRRCAAHRINGEWYHDRDEVIDAFCQAYDPHPSGLTRRQYEDIKKIQRLQEIIADENTTKVVRKNAEWSLHNFRDQQTKVGGGIL